MRTLIAGAVLMTLVGVIGCERESEPGGPGAAPPPPTGDSGATGDSGSTSAIDKDRTFELEVPAIAKNVPQGGQEKIEIEVDRGDKFTEPVTLTFKTPEGLLVTPEEVTVDADTEDVEVTVSADPAAPLGEQSIEVTGTPAQGKAVSIKVPIEVVKP